MRILALRIWDFIAEKPKCEKLRIAIDNYKHMICQCGIR